MALFPMALVLMAMAPTSSLAQSAAEVSSQSTAEQPGSERPGSEQSVSEQSEADPIEAAPEPSDASLPTLPVSPDPLTAQPGAAQQQGFPQQVAPTVTSPTVTAADAASSYLLGPGDLIEVSVYGFEEYTGPLPVLPDGTITLPLVGKVPAAGRTTGQLTDELTVVLDRILVRPYVTITLNALRPVVINVSGEVYRPGPVQLQGQTNVATNNGTGTAPPSISEAIVQAGGLTRTADIREVVVMRSQPNGQTIRTKINLWDSLWSETLPEDLLLRDGDLVFIPKSADGSSIDSRLLARSSLSPDTVRVRVVGEVTRPGEVQVSPNSSLSSAVAVAGGPTEDAKLSEVAFIRMNDAGVVEQEVVDLSNLVDNYQVQEGDVVVVAKTGTGSVLDFAARLLSPLNFLFRVFQ